MPTQLELEALHRQESSEHNAKILETKDTRGVADLVNGKAIKGQIEEAVSELTEFVPGKVVSIEFETNRNGELSGKTYEEIKSFFVENFNNFGVSAGKKELEVKHTLLKNGRTFSLKTLINTLENFTTPAEDIPGALQTLAENDINVIVESGRKTYLGKPGQYFKKMRLKSELRGDRYSNSEDDNVPLFPEGYAFAYVDFDLERIYDETNLNIKVPGVLGGTRKNHTAEIYTFSADLYLYDSDYDDVMNNSDRYKVEIYIKQYDEPINDFEYQTESRLVFSPSRRSHVANVVSAPFSSTLGFRDAITYSRLSASLSDANAVVTVPNNDTVKIETGAIYHFLRDTTFTPSFVGAVGVTINSKNGWKKIGPNFGVATLIKTAANTWFLFGDLIA